MMRMNDGTHLRWAILLGGLLAAAGLLPSSRGVAQETDDAYRTSENSRTDRESTADRNFTPADPIEAPPTDGQNTGPVRLARFAVVSGSVTWRPDDKTEWSKAVVNLPIRQGAQVWVTEGGHADVQFDDGSELRLGNNALATLKVLYSDKDGEFTQISLNEGLATLHSRHDNAVYQIDTPAASVKSKGASQIRFGVDSGSEVTVQHGDATIEGPQGSTTLHSGQYIYLADSNSPLHPKSAPAADNWDRWNDERNRVLEGRGDSHVPSNIGLVSGELDDYGSWRNDPAYGWVWCPREVAADWRPYHHGHWTWVDPFGWTWVSSEPWGWAPYHYGTWVSLSSGWGWCPGPVHQYWSPAVVHFSEYDGCVAWAPLCPWEVRYPSELSFGYWGRNWAFSFSIGSAGCYYPYGGYCVGRPFNSFYVNHFDRFRDRDFGRGVSSPSFNRFARTSEFAAANSHFIPFNASRVAGASLARTEAFGGRGQYQALGKTETSYFARGRYAAPPAAGRTPVAGPLSVAPTSMGRTPTRSFVTGVQPSQAVLKRDIYHAPASAGTAGAPRFPTGDVANRGSARTTTGVGDLANRSNGASSTGTGGLANRGNGAAAGGVDGRGNRTSATSPGGPLNSGNGSAFSNPALSGRAKAPATSGSRTADPSIPSRTLPENSGASRWNDARSSADAARKARESLGIGGRAGSSGSAAPRSDTGRDSSRTGGSVSGGYSRPSTDRTGSLPSGGVSRPDSGRNGADSSGGYTRPDTGRSGAGSTGGYTRPDTGRSGGTASGGASRTDGGTRDAGRTGGSGSGSGSTYRTSTPRSDDGGAAGSGSQRSSGSGTQGSGGYRTRGGDYSSGSSRNGGSDYGLGSSRGGGYDYSSGRARGYGGDAGSSGYTGRSEGSASSHSGGSYGGGSSGRYGDSSSSAGAGRSGGDSGGRSGGSSSSGSAGRSGGDSGGRSGGSSTSGSTGRSGGDSGGRGSDTSGSGGGSGTGRSRSGR